MSRKIWYSQTCVKRLLSKRETDFQDRLSLIASQGNRGVSHYRILPVSRDIGWPVQQLDYFRYVKQHILTIEFLHIGDNFKEIKKRHFIN